jgi:hypothetical protein
MPDLRRLCRHSLAIARRSGQSTLDGVQAHDKGWRQDAKQRAKRPRSSEKILGEAAEAREIRPPRGRERSDMALIAAI